tara:strand:+ start:6042 stop:6881 length:840 start_codon:yes stop_codon:yes gene_type:complete
MGGSVGKNKSQSAGNMSQDVWGGQGGALKDLYSQANDLWGSNQGGQLDDMADELGGYNNDLRSGAMGGFNNQMGGGSFGDTSDIRAKLMGYMDQPSQTGKMYESIVGGKGNEYIEPMVQAMKSGAMENNAMLQSGTAMDAAAMGQGGSSRQAMQNAMTNRMTNQDMMSQETSMRGGAYDKDLDMKMGIAQMADGNRQQEQDRLMGMMQGSDQNQQYGMNSGQGMQNLGMGSMAPWMQAQNQGWSNMGNYANTIGGPTVLSSGGQSGSSKGGGASGSIKG